MVFLFILNKTVCRNKRCQTNFKTFQINNCQFDDIERDFNPDLLKNLQMDIDYPVICDYVQQMGWQEVGLPEQYPQDFLQNTDFSQKLYHVLLCREIINADLVCPDCQQQFAIRDKIVIMVSE